jgi:hypothetical protein
MEEVGSMTVQRVQPVSRRWVRLAAVLVTTAVAALYVAVFLVQRPHMHETDNPAPMYLALAALYGLGAVLQAILDTRATYWVGAAVQVILIGLFAWLLKGMYAHGEESFILDMAGLAIAINTAQVVLIGLFAWLATSTPPHREMLPPPGTGPGVASHASPTSGAAK